MGISFFVVPMVIIEDLASKRIRSSINTANIRECLPEFLNFSQSCKRNSSEVPVCDNFWSTAELAAAYACVENN